MENFSQTKRLNPMARIQRPSTKAAEPRFCFMLIKLPESCLVHSSFLLFHTQTLITKNFIRTRIVQSAREPVHGTWTSFTIVAFMLWGRKHSSAGARQSWSEMFMLLLLRFRSQCALSWAWIFIRLNEHSYPFQLPCEDKDGGTGGERAMVNVNAVKNELETFRAMVLGRRWSLGHVGWELMCRNLAVSWGKSFTCYSKSVSSSRIQCSRTEPHSHDDDWWSIISRLMARFIPLNTLSKRLFFSQSKAKKKELWIEWSSKKYLWTFMTFCLENDGASLIVGVYVVWMLKRNRMVNEECWQLLWLTYVTCRWIGSRCSETSDEVKIKICFRIPIPRNCA